MTDNKEIDSFVDRAYSKVPEAAFVGTVGCLVYAAYEGIEHHALSIPAILCAGGVALVGASLKFVDKKTRSQ